MGRDGTAGCKIVHTRGGRVLAQHATGCTVYGIPKSAIQAGTANQIVELPDIAKAIQRHLAITITRIAGEISSRCWSMNAAVCLTLAGSHLFVWLRACNASLSSLTPASVTLNRPLEAQSALEWVAREVGLTSGIVIRTFWLPVFNAFGRSDFCGS